MKLKLSMPRGLGLVGTAVQVSVSDLYRSMWQSLLLCSGCYTSAWHSFSPYLDLCSIPAHARLTPPAKGSFCPF